jgi:lysophospholipase L1-like esterase
MVCHSFPYLLLACCLTWPGFGLKAAEAEVPAVSEPKSEAEAKVDTDHGEKLTVATKPPVPSDEPAQKVDSEGKPSASFMARHEKFLARTKSGPVDVLFVGDSITQGWETSGRALWKQHYEPLKAANFSIAGDRTEHVLWRLSNGELDGITPKVIVLLIGSNNYRAPEGDIMRGVRANVTLIKTKLPKTKILVLGLLPRGPEGKNSLRGKFAYVNKDLAKLDNQQQIRFLDLSPKFLDPKSKIPKDLMADGMHPTQKGYALWAEAMDPLLNAMLGPTP